MDHFYLLFTLNLASSLIMTGVIWYIQLVHYPSFKFIGLEVFEEFHSFHSRMTGIIVVPVMLLELVTSLLLTFQTHPYFWFHAAGLILVVFAWISTFTLQVPSHNILKNGFNLEQYNRLVSTNRLRIISWSAKSFVSILIFFQIFGLFEA